MLFRSAVIYARYSTDSQREESIEGQIRECTAYAEKNGITIVKHYIDRAISAKTDNRPQFQQMIKDSDKKLFDIVLVWKLDRFARNRYDSARYKTQLKRNGVKLMSATEIISEGLEGIILESVLEGYAEYYSADLAEKVVRGQTENILKGRCNGGRGTFGYTLDSERKFHIDPLVSPFVLELFKKYRDGLTMKGLGLSFSRIFTRKIEELTRNMDKVNHGSREVTVSSDSEDEVGILINSFRRMMDEINRLIDEVYVNKIALKEYELKALQAQINPHFLYNTLSMMNWMAIRSNQMDISKVTLALSTFYRTALSKGEDMVTIETCIRNMEAYLEIQLTMHDYNFTVEWDIDPDIKNEKMPKLLLQPVVENAIEHGIDEKEEGDKKLFLSFKGQGDDVEIIVRDNGTGMEQEKAETLVTYQAKGYGLKNVNDRIRLLYGEAYGIRIFSEPGEGTNVIMRFPKEIRNYED